MSALEALALRAPLPVDLQARLDDSLPEQVEAAAYYVVAEGLANVQKHAGRVASRSKCGATEGTVIVEVRDDGVGGADVEGAGCEGSRTASRPLGGRLHARRALRAQEHACSRRFRSLTDG